MWHDIYLIAQYLLPIVKYPNLKALRMRMNWENKKKYIVETLVCLFCGEIFDIC